MAESASGQVTCFSLTIANFNPNHLARFVSIGLGCNHLFDLSTGGDDSFYLIPKLAVPVGLGRLEHQAPVAFLGTIQPTDRTYISFHESGAVNVHVGRQRRTMSLASAGRPASGLMARLIFNSLAIFAPASFGDINVLPQRIAPITVIGLTDRAPICVDIYQAPADEAWVMPTPPTSFMSDYCLKPNRKTFEYHYLIWQPDGAVERHPAELVILCQRPGRARTELIR